MDSRDHLVFLFSADWFYLQPACADELSFLSSADCARVKEIARNRVRLMLNDSGNYFEADFSEKRISDTYRNFLAEVASALGGKKSSALERRLAVILAASRDYFRELWLIRQAYVTACQGDGLFSPECERTVGVCPLVRAMPDEEGAAPVALSDWDRRLGGLFDGNETEVYDFYSSVFCAALFLKTIASRIGSKSDVEKALLFDELETIVLDVSGISVGKKKISAMHRFFQDA